MAATKRYWTPTRTYDFQLKIGNLDFTPDLERVTIITSILRPYQTVVMDVFVDANDMILEKIYGQNKIILTVRLLGTTDEAPSEEVEIELEYLKTDYNLEVKTAIPQDDMKNRSAVSLITICRKPWISMASIVNGIYFESTVGSVIENLTNQIPSISRPTISIDSMGQNTEQIDQILVPPVTFLEAVKYLDKTFGVFNGPLTFYGLFDNTIYLKNLNKKVSSSHGMTFYHLTAGEQQEKIIKKPADGNTFYTWRPINTGYAANSVFGYTGGTQRHVVKPRDTLFHNIDIDVYDFAQSYGIMTRQLSRIYADDEALGFGQLQGRTAVISKNTGYEKTQTHINASLSKAVSELSTINIEITAKNIVILNLMNVGEAVKFSTSVSDYSQLTGKYILRSSEIRFLRLRDWEANARVMLMRTNRSIN